MPQRGRHSVVKNYAGRSLDGLVKAPMKPWLFDGVNMAAFARINKRKQKVRPVPSRAERNIAWCETYLHIPEGKFVGKQMVMADFMKEDFRQIYDNEHGTRRAIISRGRKNAKTTEAAM